MIAPTRRLLSFAAAAMLPLAAVAGFVPGLRGPCLGAMGVCAAVAVLDAVKGLARVRELDFRLPELLRVTKGVATVVPIGVENRIGMAVPIRVALFGSVKDITAPRGKSTVDWEVTSETRGDVPLGMLFVETASPLGLWAARTGVASNCTLRVYPNLRDRATAGLFLKTANVGMRLHRQVGKGREFENLRHYLPGDSFEDIHWKATAKRGSPAVKLYRVEHAQEVYAVVDCSRLSAREGILESYVDAALHLALVAERQGDRFGLVTFSDRTHRLIRARNGMDHFRVCREAIYNLRAERVSPDFREAFTSLLLNLRRRSLLVFFTSLDDALLAENFERDIALLSRRHLVLVNVSRTSGMRPLFEGEEPENLDSVYADLAGQMRWNRMRRLQIALQNRGVRLAVVDPERIKMEVTSQYLDVKRRQAL